MFGKDAAYIWPQFVHLMKQGDFPAEEMRPYHPALKEPMVGFLKRMQEKAIWEEWQTKPGIYEVGNRVHFLIPLTFDGQKWTYCFSFLQDEEAWYFQHLETITIRLDKLPALPASDFPDLPEKTKAWMREEIRIPQLIRLYNYLYSQKGHSFALSWLKDGAGYVLAAKSWVPFLPESKAFILYLCWEQSKLCGNRVTLESLNDRQAIVRLHPVYFNLYATSAHLRQQISEEEYRRIFETVWQDGAEKAGWEFKIQYDDSDVVFVFTASEFE